MGEGEQPEVDMEQLAEQLASFSVEQFLISAASTIASLAYAKLVREDLRQAKKAIDALAALAPLVSDELGSSLRAALADLQVAYASR